MEPIIFNVKDKSANAFFSEYLIISDKFQRRNINNTDEMSPYYFMKDEIILKNSSGITAGQQVVFHLADESAASRKPLTNVYTYEAEKYDDVSVRLTLAKFQITIDNVKQTS